MPVMVTFDDPGLHKATSSGWHGRSVSVPDTDAVALAPVRVGHRLAQPARRDALLARVADERRPARGRSASGRRR